MSGTIAAPESNLAVAVRENPFPGLRPFREEEEHLFFGRESQVDRMVDKLAATRFLAVLGSSGSGKSSLVNCGLKPALHRGLMPRAGTNWRVVQFRPGSDPIRCMAQAFADEIDFFGETSPDEEAALGMLEATLKMSSLGVADLYEFARFEPGTNLLVVADQFEELFRFSRIQAGGQAPTASAAEVNSDAVAFVNLLLEANAQEKYPIYVVVTMRSDFLGECSHFDRLPEVMNESQYLVPRLTREERRAAISGPIAVTEAALSPVLLTRLVNDVGDDPAHLSILQHAVNRTWAAWQRKTNGEGEISLDDYIATGTMATALDAHAEEAFAELTGEGEQALCERIFKALTDRGTDSRGIRRPLPMHRLCEIVGASAAEVLPVLAVFRDQSRSFLMPPLSEQVGPGTTIDISHEILMRVWERLKQWAGEEAQSAAIYRRLAETAELHAAEKAELWRDRDLQTALEWQLKEQPNKAWAALYRSGFDAAMEFLALSKRVRDKERAEAEFERRWKRVTPILAIVTFALFVYGSLKLSGNFTQYVETDQKSTGAHIFGSSPMSDDTVKTFLAAGNVACYSLLAVLGLGLYGGLTNLGKRGFRIIVYPRIEEEAKVVARIEPAPTLDPAPIHLTYAGLFPRLGAGIINLIGVVLLSVFLFLLFRKTVFADDRVYVLTFAIVVPALFLYRMIMTRTRWAGTLGEVWCGITVKDKAGARPGLGRSIIRFVIHLCLSLFIPLVAFIALVLPTISTTKYSTPGALSVTILSILPAMYLLQIFTPRKQALHDLIAGTVVVRKNPRPKGPESTAAALIEAQLPVKTKGD